MFFLDTKENALFIFRPPLLPIGLSSVRLNWESRPHKWSWPCCCYKSQTDALGAGLIHGTKFTVRRSYSWRIGILSAVLLFWNVSFRWFCNAWVGVLLFCLIKNVLIFKIIAYAKNDFNIDNGRIRLNWCNNKNTSTLKYTKFSTFIPRWRLWNDGVKKAVERWKLTKDSEDQSSPAERIKHLTKVLLGILLTLYKSLDNFTTCVLTAESRNVCIGLSVFIFLGI